MQAGLAKKRLTFRDVFTSWAALFLLVLMEALAGYSRLHYKSVAFGFLEKRGRGSTTLA